MGAGIGPSRLCNVRTEDPRIKDVYCVLQSVHVAIRQLRVSPGLGTAHGAPLYLTIIEFSICFANAKRQGTSSYEMETRGALQRDPRRDEVMLVTRAA